MVSVSDIKANTVHDRTKRSCLHCEKYFIPRNSLPQYVEGKTSQVWCSKACYIILFPQVVEGIQCRFCPAIFVPKSKRNITCGSEGCIKKRKNEIRREKGMKDPKYRENINNKQKEKMKDPEYRENVNKKNRESTRERMKDPEYRESVNSNHREYMQEKAKDPEHVEKLRKRYEERRSDPEVREEDNKKIRDRRKNDPQYRERVNKYQRDRGKNKESKE